MLILPDKVEGETYFIMCENISHFCCKLMFLTEIEYGEREIKVWSSGSFVLVNNPCSESYLPGIIHVPVH